MTVNAELGRETGDYDDGGSAYERLVRWTNLVSAQEQHSPLQGGVQLHDDSVRRSLLPLQHVLHNYTKHNEGIR